MAEKRKRQVSWSCSVCTLINTKDYQNCSACHSPAPTDSTLWSCRKCTYRNQFSAIECEMCLSPPLLPISSSDKIESIVSLSKGDWASGIICPASAELLKSIMNGSPREIVLSSFQTDVEWILSQVVPSCIARLVFVMNSPPSPEQQPDQARVGPFLLTQKGRLLFVFPKLRNSGYGCMHVKLYRFSHYRMLLVHDDLLRLVISSANLVAYDWNILENIVYIQDFPKLSNPCTIPGRFQVDLCKVLESLRVPESIIRILGNYDFSLANGHLIFSRPGVFKKDAEPESYSSTGLLSLYRAVSQFMPDSSEPVVCEYMVHQWPYHRLLPWGA